MSDDLSKRGKIDRERVNVHESWEVEWWCKELGCTKDELFAAVNAVGPMVEDVKAWLARNRRK